MEFNIDNFHPFVLNVGLALHNADWNWKNVSTLLLAFIMS